MYSVIFGFQFKFHFTDYLGFLYIAFALKVYPFVKSMSKIASGSCLVQNIWLGLGLGTVLDPGLIVGIRLV